MSAEVLKRAVDEYLNFEVAGKRVKIPYVLDYGRWNFWRTCGKGSPSEIKQELLQVAHKKNFDLDSATSFEIYKFMKKNNIGVDCSGFVYNVLAPFILEKTGKHLSLLLLRYPGWLGKIEKFLFSYKRKRRIGVSVLTSALNTFEVSLPQIQLGDLIKISCPHSDYPHLAVVVEVETSKGSLNRIVYAHSSKLTQKQGPHLGIINIINPNLGLEGQNWEEMLKDGRNYGKICFRPTMGGGVRRVRWVNFSVS